MRNESRRIMERGKEKGKDQSRVFFLRASNFTSTKSHFRILDVSDL